jgi:hypothetical protein
MRVNVCNSLITAEHQIYEVLEERYEKFNWDYQYLETELEF